MPVANRPVRLERHITEHFGLDGEILVWIFRPMLAISPGVVLYSPDQCGNSFRKQFSSLVDAYKRFFIVIFFLSFDLVYRLESSD